MYDILVAKVNNVYTSGFGLKTNYGPDISNLGKKVPYTCELVKKKTIMLQLRT